MSRADDGSESRRQQYAELVEQRKRCRLCSGLTNPSQVKGGRFDADHIGPWSLWQGNIDSPLVILGQDWGTPEVFAEARGVEPFCAETDKNTNGMLVDLLRSIGITIHRPLGRTTLGKLFFTNAILCLKHGDAQAPVEQEWFDQCGAKFIVPLLKIVAPEAVITLGEKAYRALERSFGLERRPFAQAVELPIGIRLFGETRLFPMYHCGRRILNTHRKLDKQLADWGRVGSHLRRRGITIA